MSDLTGREIIVVIYEHKHGVDVILCADDDAALRAKADIAREWWDEITHRDDVPEQPPADDAEVVRVYFAAQEGAESIETTTRRVIS